MKTVLVTGASGFLGGYVVREFVRSGWHVLATGSAAPENAGLPPQAEYVTMRLPGDGMAARIADWKPDVCVHCAGRASVADSMRSPAEDFEAGVRVTTLLLEALRNGAPGCRVVFLSSAAVYGQLESLPIAELARCLPLSPYGYHKRMAELLVEQYARMHGVPGCSVRIFSAYGPGLRRQILWEICSQLATQGGVTLQGTGRESRDFIHASDVARAVVLLAERAPAEGECYNLASGIETSIAEVTDGLCAWFPGSGSPKFLGMQREGDPQNWRADITRLQALGFEPRVPFAQGLETVATWAKTLLG